MQIKAERVVFFNVEREGMREALLLPYCCLLVFKWERKRFLIKACSDKTRSHAFEQKGLIVCKEEIFYNENSEPLEQVSQSSCGCPNIVSIPSSVARGFEQPDVVRDALAHGRGMRLDDLRVLFQPKLFQVSFTL